MNRIKPFTPLILLALLVLSMVNVSVVAVEYTVAYEIYPDGTALVTLHVTDITDELYVEVPVYDPIDPNTIDVLDEEGLPLAFEYNGTHIIVYTFNSTSITLSYIANIGVVVEETVTVTITPQGPSTIILPEDSILLGFTGEPLITYQDDAVVLEYDIPLTYNITFIVPVEVPIETITLTEATTLTETKLLTVMHPVTIMTTTTLTKTVKEVFTETTTYTLTSTQVVEKTVSTTYTTTTTIKALEAEYYMYGLIVAIIIIVALLALLLRTRR